ncbi:DUF3829 domain-containing protein [Acinetobacter larvae]|uniref:DUF3829 domain-containing protein n=1 Tax=Acinetobacter larvae TaxID=1789224 RepID=A0A1B2M051_9GAMM|nr:DUF3829 domain-containing protein [Acinetobacter larvae]AOA58560.1 hypothetical protein BFG52_09480 [Acinetobacter larvae]
MRFNTLVITAFVSALSLTACGNKEGQKEQAATATTEQSSNINAYIAISNQLIGLNGLKATQDAYHKLNITQAMPSQALSYPSMNYKYLNDQFTQAEQSTKNNPALESKAADLKQKIAQLEKDYNDFNLYYSSGEYKTDQLAKGKAADASIREHFQQASDSFDAFQQELAVIYQQQKKAELEKLKTSGDDYNYHRRAALSTAENLVSVFQSETDLNNADKIKQADQFAAELQTELSALDAEYNKKKAQDPNINADTVLSNLTACLKYYRQFKETKSQYDFKFMIDGYNSAVKSANR